MATVRDVITREQAAIMDRWYEQARTAASARGLDHPAMFNAMPRYLAALAAGKDGHASVEHHLASRVRQGFQVGEIVDEFVLLGRCISDQCFALPEASRPDAADIDRLHGELQRAASAIADMFDRHMHDDEQTDKRYVRLLRETASLPGGARALEPVLELVMEAMGAQTAAILLRDRDQRLTTIATAGLEHHEECATEVGALPFAEIFAHSQESTSLWDVSCTSKLDVPVALRKCGIDALLGVGLHTRSGRSGVLYVGISETREFSAAERRRLETLAEQLVVHVEGAALFEDLTTTIATLRTERSLREHFVAVLAHDLRGPLAAAKLGAELMHQAPAPRPDLATRIMHNLDRMDRMIRDLLDANRIRAGERVPLQIEPCDLGALVRDVADELRMLYGDRFIVEADEGIRGHWSPDELRRALWNLGQNATKYGTADRPIQLTVRATATTVRISVHNEGPAIAMADQKHLFDPFARTQSAVESGRAGWGLGLALVRGCAEAHGGRVSVASTPADGTTFTIELPRDARPHQTQSSVATSQTMSAQSS